MYAVKVTCNFLGMEFVDYVGLRGEHKRDLNKVEGWKKESTAEKWIASNKRMEGIFGGLDREYEIVTL